jgi:hypothetical protein
MKHIDVRISSNHAITESDIYNALWLYLTYHCKVTPIKKRVRLKCKDDCISKDCYGCDRNEYIKFRDRYKQAKRKGRG